MRSSVIVFALLLITFGTTPLDAQDKVCQFNIETEPVTPFATGWMASEYGLRPYPFYIGVGLAGLGLLGSWLMIKDTIHHVRAESETSTVPKLNRLFAETTWKHPNLDSAPLSSTPPS